MGWRQGDKFYTNNWSFIYIQPFLQDRQALNRYMNGTATLGDRTIEQVVGSTSDSHCRSWYCWWSYVRLLHVGQHRASTAI